MHDMHHSARPINTYGIISGSLYHLFNTFSLQVIIFYIVGALETHCEHLVTSLTEYFTFLVIN